MLFCLVIKSAFSNIYKSLFNQNNDFCVLFITKQSWSRLASPDKSHRQSHASHSITICHNQRLKGPIVLQPENGAVLCACWCLRGAEAEETHRHILYYFKAWDAHFLIYFYILFYCFWHANWSWFSLARCQWLHQLAVAYSTNLSDLPWLHRTDPLIISGNKSLQSDLWCVFTGLCTDVFNMLSILFKLVLYMKGEWVFNKLYQLHLVKESRNWLNHFSKASSLDSLLCCHHVTWTWKSPNQEDHVTCNWTGRQIRFDNTVVTRKNLQKHKLSHRLETS